MRESTAKPPKHLSREAKTLWRELADEYDITDSAGLAILSTACEALDRLRACQTEIAKDGQQVKDRFGGLRPHGLLSVENLARTAFLAALKQLNLDLEPLRDRFVRPGRR